MGTIIPIVYGRGISKLILALSDQCTVWVLTLQDVHQKRVLVDLLEIQGGVICDGTDLQEDVMRGGTIEQSVDADEFISTVT